MNALLRLFGMRDDPPITRPCPTCGTPILVSPANPHIDRYSETGLKRALLDGQIGVQEFVDEFEAARS